MKTYKDLQRAYETSQLSKRGVKLPRENSQKGQVLLFLFQNKGKIVTKADAEKVVCERMNKQPKDLQSLRHLGKQSGFNILQVGATYRGRKLKKGEYVLVNLSETNPYFNNNRRDESILNFSHIKQKYNNK